MSFSVVVAFAIACYVRNKINNRNDLELSTPNLLTAYPLPKPWIWSLNLKLYAYFRIILGAGVFPKHQLCPSCNITTSFESTNIHILKTYLRYMNLHIAIFFYFFVFFFYRVLRYITNQNKHSSFIKWMTWVVGRYLISEYHLLFRFIVNSI